VVRRARSPPAEAALDSADVDDGLGAAIRVRRIVLPARDPLEHRVEHVACPQDRVAVAPPLAEGRMDEVPVDADPEPQSAEVAQHALAPGRLAEQAHVRYAAVRDEVARPGRVASVLRSLLFALLRLLDLAADGRDQDVSTQTHTGVLQRPHRLDVAGDRALH